MIKKEGEGRGRREGEVVGRGRRGGEKRRGIVIGRMVLGLLMGCNNGLADELAAEKRLGEIGRSAENVFYSFMGLIADTLGFTVKADTKKNEVGDHFNKLGVKMGEASDKLEEIAKKASADGDRDGLLSKAIKEAVVDAANVTLNTLKSHLESLGTISTGDTNVVGWAASATQGAAAADVELKKATDALKGIVRLAKDSKAITELKKSDKEVSTVTGVATPQDGIKILGTNAQPTANDEAKATGILSKVNGEEILSAIVSSNDGDTVGGSADGTTSAIAFAKGANVSNLSQGTAKISAVAGGIALRSLVKSGKLGATSNLQAVSQGAGTMAANKLIVKLEDLIKKTVKNVLEKAKGEIDKARTQKPTV